MAAKQTIPELDGLRALAVLLVLWAHVPVGALGAPVDSLRAWLHPAYLGVDLFFVLSGFLITRILLADKERAIPLRFFLLRRFLRIFPIYYLTLAVVAFWQPGPELKWCFAYLSNAYFPFHAETSVVRHTWSLAVEEHFYLLWPLLVYGLSTTASRRALWLVFLPLAIGTAVGAILVADAPAFASWIADLKRRGAIDYYEPQRFVYMFSSCRALSLSIGALFAFHESAIRRRARAAGLVGFAVAVAALATIGGLATTAGGAFGLGLASWTRGLLSQWYGLVRLLIFSLASGGFVLATVAFAESRFPPARLLATAPLRGIGRISYALYLYHLPLFHALSVYGAPGSDPTRRALVGLAAAFALATASYLVIERPLLRIGARFRGAARERAQAKIPT